MSGNDGKVMTIINGLAKSDANYGHRRCKGTCMQLHAVALMANGSGCPSGVLIIRHIDP